MAAPNPSPASPPEARHGNAGLVLLAGLLAVFGLAAAGVASSKPLWHDEIFTVVLCRLPDMASVWRELQTGMEQMPPLTHVLSRVAYSAGGGTPFAVRLASIIGLGVFVLCVFFVLRPRLPVEYSLAGAAIPFLTQALHFAYEARPYAVVLGFTGVAVLCWDRAPERRGRALAITGLAVACAAAVSCHYYAVLIVIPLAAGELARSLRPPRFDAAVWIALASPLVPLAAFLPLIRAARSFATSFWARPQLSTFGDAYAYLVGLAAPLFIALAIFWAAYLAFARRRDGAADAGGLNAGLAVSAGFIALPAIAVVSAFATGAFAPRYAIWAVAGLALGIPYLAYRTTSASRTFGRVMATYLLCAAVLVQFVAWKKWHAAGGEPASIAMIEPLTHIGLPVVYADPVGYVQFAWYAPRILNERVYYISEPKAALRVLGSDSAERALLQLSKLTSLHTSSLAPFLAEHERFLVYEAGDLSWLVPELLARGASLTLRGGFGEGRVYEVSCRPQPATGATVTGPRPREKTRPMIAD